jgi:formate dehydrogenase subunit beta
VEELTLQLRRTAKEILEKGEAQLVIGWEKGAFWYSSTPAFISKPEDTERLIWDEYCVNNLAKYLLDYRHKEGKTAVFVKGCDARALNVLLQDKQLKREKILIIGLACPGMKDEAEARKLGQDASIPLYKKCRECRYPNAINYDLFIGEDKVIKEVPAQEDFSEVQALESLSPDEKYNKFAANYDRCLRCYACRNICPACNCRECIFDQTAAGWSAKANNVSENMFFALTRALHVAGRCVGCGECERACPVNIPIMLLNKKIIQDINGLFGEYEAGTDVTAKLPLGGFEFTDPEEFM